MYSTDTHPNIHKVRVCRCFKMFWPPLLENSNSRKPEYQNTEWQPNLLHRQMFAGAYSTGQTINYRGTLIILKARDYWHYYSTKIPKFWLRKKDLKTRVALDQFQIFSCFLALKFWQKFRMFQFVKTTWWFALSQSKTHVECLLSHQRPKHGSNSYDFSRFGISLLNFQIQVEQNSIALLMLMYYQQAFLRVAAVFRRRRF